VKLNRVYQALQGKVGYVWQGRRAETPQWQQQFTDTLRRLVDTWLAEGRNFSRWQEKNPQLARRVMRVARTFRQVLHVPPALSPMWLQRRRLPRKLKECAAYEATSLFLELVTSWRASELGKCPYCEEYFLNSSGHEKLYCSRKCTLAASALRSTEKRRKEEHEKKLKMAVALIEEYQSHHRREDLKTWAAGRQAITGISRHWLTRALNRGLIKPPSRNQAPSPQRRSSL
jgi:hypothetical protein